MKNKTLLTGLGKITFVSLLILPNTKVVGQTGGAIFEVGPTMMRTEMFPMSTLLDNGNVVTFSGREAGFVSSSYSQIYNVTNNSFTESAMNFPHDASATVKLFDGRFLLLGGGDNLGIAPGFSSVETYDQMTGLFSPLPSMTMGRMQHSAVQLGNGNVLIAGAWYNTEGATYGEIYDPDANIFTPTGAMNDPRSQTILFPTDDEDEGAIVIGGWDTYGGSIKTTVEYYSSDNNSFTLQSSELIPTDSGWVPQPMYTKLFTDCKMNNGNYLFLAARNISTLEYALIEFNPFTKTFSKINTTFPLVDSLTDGGFYDFVLNNMNNEVYLIGIKAGSSPLGISIVTVDLSTGNIYHPTTSYTLPSDEYFRASFTYVPYNGKILVMGISSVDDNFSATDKTYLITPQTITSIHTTDKNDMNLFCYPNPATDKLTINLKVFKSEIYTIQLSDMLGRIMYNETRFSSPNQNIWSLDLKEFNKGIYTLSVKTGTKTATQKIVINE